jgi:hypothetical protein
MLTVLKQAHAISAKVIGPGKKTVISLDMGLYEPAKKLQMARNDLEHIVLRPGELHVLMAQLRTLGSFVDNSGIDLCWIESDLYGPATVKQIIDGNHVKGGLTIHMVTLQVLFTLYQKSFFSTLDNHSVLKIEELAKNVGNACTDGKKTEVSKASQQMVEGLRSLDITRKMENFEEENSKNPEFQVSNCYCEW